jgi:hypothetical protein
LLAGFCFGLGYGLTTRLLALQLPSLVRLGQGFEVRPIPGTSLESLRLRFGADSQEIRGDLDLLQLEQQTGADRPPVQPEPRPATTLDAPPARDELDPTPQPEPAPKPDPAVEPRPQPSPAAAVDAPAPPQVTGADLPQSTPDSGLR